MLNTVIWNARGLNNRDHQLAIKDVVAEFRDWSTDITSALKRWRSKHIVDMPYRALLASCVYHIWKERNLRRFEHIERTPTTMASVILEAIRKRINSITLPRSISTQALFRLWRIPWPVKGETN
ncbi:UNVERIFIED_CONTAM: hypothetical protein Sindi_2022000 [Sesamum indicum]